MELNEVEVHVLVAETVYQLLQVVEVLLDRSLLRRHGASRIRGCLPLIGQLDIAQHQNIVRDHKQFTNGNVDLLRSPPQCQRVLQGILRQPVYEAAEGLGHGDDILRRNVFP